MSDFGNKEVFAKNLKKYMDLNNLDRMALAEKTGFSYTSITDWVNANNYPYIDKIEKLADFFGVTKAHLIENVSGRLDSLEKDVVRVPLLGKVPAGMPFEAIEDEYTIDYEEIPTKWTKGNKKYFALKIVGDSMAPEYNDGDSVVFLVSPVCSSGQDCCVRIGGSDATFKRVTIKDNGILLTPLNLDNSTGFLPTFYTKDEVENTPVEILGIAKKHVKYL